MSRPPQRKIAPHPWNHWYHVMCHTYGTWLPGDPKGFRTRHHREHVEGDYKNPPPKGKYDPLWQRSKDLMKRDPVYLTIQQRHRAADEFVRAFHKWHIDLRIVSIDRIHMHALIRVPDHNPRHYVGLAKKESSAYMKQDHLAEPGGLWAVRCKCLPIADASHFDSATDYIHDHESLGAAIREP
jgi:REP element-mobilizing transposase RayT